MERSTLLNHFDHLASVGKDAEAESSRLKKLMDRKSFKKLSAKKQERMLRRQNDTEAVQRYVAHACCLIEEQLEKQK